MAHPASTRETPYTLTPAKGPFTLAQRHPHPLKPLNLPLKSQCLSSLFFRRPFSTSSSKARLGLRNLQLIDRLEQLIDLVSASSDILLQLRIRLLSAFDLQLEVFDCTVYVAY